MKITVVKYEKLHSLGNYENEKVGVEIQVEDGEEPAAVLAHARAFVELDLRARDQERQEARARQRAAQEAEWARQMAAERQGPPDGDPDLLPF